MGLGSQSVAFAGSKLGSSQGLRNQLFFLAYYLSEYYSAS
jgi:hypothetical protein